MTPKEGQIYNHDHNDEIRSNYRPSEYKITDVNLHIDLDDTETVVKNRMTVEPNPAAVKQGGPLVLNGEDIDLISLRILENGVWRDLDRSEFLVDDKQLILTHPPTGRFELEVVNQTNPEENTKLSGIYKSGDIIGSQNESQGFRRITYYLDRPDNLAKFTTTLEADKAKYPVMISNGNGDVRKTKDLGNGRHQITWVDPWPKPSYLFATIAGDIKLVEDTFTTMSGKQVKLVIAVPPGYENKVDFAMESLKRAMKWDEEKYGREYDLDVLHLIGLEKFNMGAMENKGAIVFNIKDLCGSTETSSDSELLRIETVVGHEYFHNWTGNRVTVRDWFEISLKESLTELRNEQFSADMNSAAIETIDNANVLRGAQFREDAGPTAHCVRPERVEAFDNIYSLTVYQKGARVLNMMKTILGDEMWRVAMDEYFRKYDGKAVTVDDFIDNMQEVSGIDLTQFRRWYSQSGTPEISYDGKYDAAAKTYTLTLRQHTPATADQLQSEKKALHIPVSVGLIGKSGNDVDLIMDGDGLEKIKRTTRVLNLTKDEQTFVFRNVSNINVPIVPSVLRGFSAPVKIMTQPSDAELIFRMAFDSDKFNRFEAAERLKLKTVLSLLKDQAAGRPLKLDADLVGAIGAVLANATDDDQAFAARMLSMPSLSIIAQQVTPVDPIAVVDVLKFMRKAIAQTFKDDFERIYKETTAPAVEAYNVVPKQTGRRALHNFALTYLSFLETPEVAKVAEEQYRTATNMTEKDGALDVLAALPDAAAADKAIESFYQAYKHDTNVVDNWLSTQALNARPENAVARVQALLEHEAFDWTNPNKVRALIGGWGFASNTRAFHNVDGSGYKFVADAVIKLASINDHTAAAIVQPLTQFAMYTPERQKLMIDQLKRIAAAEGVHDQTKDLVGKALASVKKEKQSQPKPASG